MSARRPRRPQPRRPSPRRPSPRLPSSASGTPDRRLWLIVALALPVSVSLFLIVFLLVQHHTLAPCEILRRDLTFGLGREYIVAVMPGASKEEISEAAVLEVVTPIVDEELAGLTAWSCIGGIYRFTFGDGLLPSGR